MTKRTLVFVMLLILKPTENGKPPTTFRLTKVQCEVYDKSWIRVNLCECRPVRRGITIFNLNVTFLRPANDIYINVALFKKDRWYKPFLVNFTINGCEYLRKRNHPLLNLIYDHFKSFSNINHTCPFSGDMILKDWYLRLDLLQKVSIPNGEYAIHFTESLHGIKAHATRVFVEYINFFNDVNT